MNLLEETYRAIKENGHTIEDIYYVTDGHCSATWEEFADMAKDIDYNAGYGLEEINVGLKIIGRGWWLERANYDGSEWWAYKSIPTVRPFSGNLWIKNEW